MQKPISDKLMEFLESNGIELHSKHIEGKWKIKIEYASPDDGYINFQVECEEGDENFCEAFRDVVKNNFDVDTYVKDMINMDCTLPVEQLVQDGKEIVKELDDIMNKLDDNCEKEVQGPCQ